MTQEVIILGAPRSGTNMLRDVLTRLPGVGTWPCDEINLVWRHGNRDHPSDELTVEMARPEVCHYLHRQFAKVGERCRVDTVVEKTCANSLRVPFVTRAFPHAKYIVIQRDGIDAAASAVQRWNAPLELGYTARKARFVPPKDVPHYAGQFALDLLSRSVRTSTPKGAATWWGPKTYDFNELRSEHPVEELSVIQWQRCVDATLDAFDRLHGVQVLRVGYEEFVREPYEGLQRILGYLDMPERYTSEAVVGVSSSSVGKGRSCFDPRTVRRLETLAGPTLRKLGYV